MKCRRGIGFFSKVFVVGLVLASCASSPTVPVPPPEMWGVDAPDAEGYARVIGKPGAAEAGDEVLVFNEDLDVGAIGVAEEDGSFEVWVEADPGDTILLQIKRDDILSSTDNRTVPAG